jgi:hypothetical protein
MMIQNIFLSVNEETRLSADGWTSKECKTFRFIQLVLQLLIKLLWFEVWFEGVDIRFPCYFGSH